MKIRNLLYSLTALLFGTVSAYSQSISVTNTQSPADLVQNVLAGTGVTIFNITYNGSAPSAQNIQTPIGYFTENGSGFPLSEGLIISTGQATAAAGVASTFVSTSLGYPGDADLNQLSTAATQDAVVLEFDFIPMGDTVSFNFVFASEEYPDYDPYLQWNQNTQKYDTIFPAFNDVFGFFLSGPGINGPFSNNAENVAYLTNGDVISINSINTIFNSSYFVDNAGGTSHVYGGSSTVLSTILPTNLVCGLTYHFKIALADAGDSAFDTAIFLEGGSFSSNSPDINIQLVDVNGNPLVGNELIEGCSSAAINFIKPNGYTDSTLVVPVLVSGSATNGTDYTQINSSYIIPPGQDTLTITIDALSDAQLEATETLIIETYYVTPCGDTISVSANINIIDNPPSYNVFANDTIIDCPSPTIDITAWTDGGIPNLTFDWGIYGTGATASLPGNIPGTTTYTVTVTDQCGMVQDTTVDITLNPAPVPTIDFNQNTFVICPGDVASIDATVNNPYNLGSLTYDWQPTGQTIEDIDVSPNVLTWYYLTINDGCYEVTDSVKIDMGTVTLTDIAVVDATNCLTLPGTPGSISVLPNDPTWTYTLIGGGNTFGPQTNGNFNGLTGGIFYFLNVVNDDGCSIDTLVEVGLGMNEVTATFILSDSIVTCFGDNDAAASVQNIGGGVTPPYDVTWTNTGGIFDSETVLAGGSSSQNSLFGQSWVVTITDQAGCAKSFPFTITSPAELTISLTGGPPNCYLFSDGSVTVNTAGGNGGNTVLIWDEQLNNLNQNGLVLSANLLSEGWYYASVEDSKGCFAEDSIFLDDPDELLVDMSIFQPNCYGLPTGYVSVDTVYNYNGSYDSLEYQWNPNPSGTPNGVGVNLITHLGAGQYILTVLDENGCDNTFNFDIVYPPQMYLPAGSFGSYPAYCRTDAGQSGNGVVYGAAAGGTQPYTSYTWTNLQTGQTWPNTTWGSLNPGDYLFTVLDFNLCKLEQVITLDSLNPSAEFTVESPQFLTDGIYEGTAEVCITFTNESEYFANPYNPLADTTFYWNLSYDAANPGQGWELSESYGEVFDTCFTSAGEYEICLVATNKNGCTDTTCKTMIIYDPLQFTPVNVFTPNGDGDNDYFTFQYWAQAVDQFECTIVNRWGITVYIMDDIMDEWDGTDMNGSPCNDGIYYYTYTGVSTDGTPLSGQGYTYIIGSGL